MTSKHIAKPLVTTNATTSPVRRFLERSVNIYSIVAVVAMNTIIALVVANLLCHVILQVWAKQDEQQKDKRMLSLFTEKYPDYTVPQYKEILSETRRQHQYEYAPYIGYKFRPEWRPYLHIANPGFRCSTKNGPWPLSPNSLNVFVFGASTTFGPGLTDDETIPAQLQDFLKGKSNKPIYVYNFGASGFNSTTERVQFANMLAQGIKPDIAVFVDGNMDSQFYIDEPPLTNEMRILMKDRGYGLLKASMPLLHDLPMTKLSDKFRETLSAKAGQSKKAGHATRPRYTTEQSDHIISRYLSNKRLIEVQAQAYGVKTLFVWQPCSSYKFDRTNHPFPQDVSHADMVPTYERMAEKVKTGSPEFAKDFLWLADIQQGLTEVCYVDDNHYRANLCKIVATEIGKTMLDRNILAKAAAPHIESQPEI